VAGPQFATRQPNLPHRLDGVIERTIAEAVALDADGDSREWIEDSATRPKSRRLYIGDPPGDP
jgi:hypothetical protein